MKIFNQIKKTSLLLLVIAAGFTACNKLELDPTLNIQPVQDTTPTLAKLLDAPNFSLLKAAVTKAGLMPTLANPTLRFTIFAPDDAAITASLTPILPPGVTPLFFINNVLSVANARGLISYHVIPQVIGSASIATTFPNFQYPTLINPAPAASALLRLTTFPSVRANGAWVNNVPITSVDLKAVNGVIHTVLRLVNPPSTDLWSKINTDTALTYLKAAIQRADSGVAVGGRLQSALDLATNPSSIASNLTVFAPTDAAMKAFLTGAITQALVGRGFPLATSQFAAGVIVNVGGTTLLSNPSALPDIPGIPVVNLGPQLSGIITPTLAKGIVAYHVLSKQSGSYAPPGIRVFSVNIPATATVVKTLLNSGVPTHPGVTVQATFASPFPGISVVTAATVKGAANATASNVIVGSTTSDLHYVNGVLHKIDQVLLPQ